jgi:acetyl-CoA carboxylase carboxyltransferase component
VAPGEGGPRRAPTEDPHDRDVTPYPHTLAGSDFTTVGDIFSPATNADRKKAFDIRTLMRAVADQDHGILERWAGMADAETAVVFDARIGGIPVCLLGIESKTVPRRGVPPTDGPIVFVVVSRYHGGAFVVFSKALNPRMTVLAVEGSFASVIGGAPAAAVVFARDVDARTAADPRVAELQHRVGEASGAERAALATELASVRQAVRAEMLGKVASEFDRVHDIHRAVEVGSVDAVIAPEEIRPRIIAAIEATEGSASPATAAAAT